MKTLLTLLLACIGSAAFAQRSYLHKEIEDDGKRLHIRVDAEGEGRNVHYKRSFDVRRMDKEEKDRLVSQIMDSLGVAETPAASRSAHVAGVATSYRSDQKRLSGKTTYREAKNNCDEEKLTSESDSSEPAEPEDAYASSKEGMEKVAGRIPYWRRIQEDRQNNRLMMHFEYRMNGEEFIYERTVNLDGKSEKDKKRIIQETERRLGLNVEQ